jgi:uracil-DNA glycosylase
MLKYFKPVNGAEPSIGDKRKREDDVGAAASATRNAAPNEGSPAAKRVAIAAAGSAASAAPTAVARAATGASPGASRAKGSDMPAPSAERLAEERASAASSSPSDLAAAAAAAGTSVADATAALAALDINVHSSWAPVVLAEARKPYFKKLQAFLLERRGKAVVYPPASDVFSALRLTPLDAVRVVILGQDPYHQPGQAHGLAFSVQRGVQAPPSLANMLKEAADDVGIRKPSHGNLEYWARQGVLLLNAVLTVERGAANAHQKQGWEEFTTAIIRAVNAQRSGVVFLLWGKPAQVKAALVDRSRHRVLEAAHPSPLSAYRGFLGCKHFSAANAYLASQGKTPIDWNLDPPGGGPNEAQAGPAAGGAGAALSAAQPAVATAAAPPGTAAGGKSGRGV